MSYIVIYEYYGDYGDYGRDWTDQFDEFETYDKLIEFMADMQFRCGNEHRWQYILKTDKNMLDLYWKDVNIRVEQMKMEKERDDRLRKELAKQKAIQVEQEREVYERALLKELIKKYGDIQ